jgi:class 3 adenylate cyclase/ABC-type branched-subunit amino acid transport system substrate-binding protein
MGGDPDTIASTPASAAGVTATRGFLFCDLRDYTRFVDERGAVAAAELLLRYRALVRGAVETYSGAEIKTEGDSFYVVFRSVTDAVACAVAIVAGAAGSTGADPIRVGVGVHAGETVETADGFVGQSVNIAARLCALAPAGEVFASDTVRALTQGVSPVRFNPRGRRRLKGISEPVAVFSVEPAGATPRRGPRSRRWWLAAGGTAAVAIGILSVAAFLLTRPPPITGTWKIGVSLPLTGFFGDVAAATRDAIDLALKAGTDQGALAGSQIVIDPRDDMPNEIDAAGDNAHAFVSDPATVAIIGPFMSEQAVEQIPITNEAGLLECSPTNTDPRLTKTAGGAGALRAAFPDRINYVRLPPAADVETRASASFAFHDLGRKSALVIEDTQEVPHAVAVAFQHEFEALAGKDSAQLLALNPDDDPSPLLGRLSGMTDPIVFFGGFTSSGAPDVRREMVNDGYEAVPFLSWDGMFDGSGQVDGSFINQTGAAAAGSYISHPTLGAVSNSFNDQFRSAYGDLPSGGDYDNAAAGYACTQVVLQALERVLPTVSTEAALREGVRAYVVDTSHEFETVLGKVSFDANGDSVRQVVSFYRVDPAAAGGTGDWALLKQQDFGSGN